MHHLCYLCLVFVMLSRLFIAALWSLAGKALASWLLFVMLNCVCVTFPCGILGQVWFLIVSIPDLCRLSYSCMCSVLVEPDHQSLPYSMYSSGEDSGETVRLHKLY